MRCVIVDDDIVFAETLLKAIRDFFRKKGENVNVCCMDGCSLGDNVANKSLFDLYLLDIEMPRISGLELARKILMADRNARIIFVTSHNEYALNSIKLGTYYYIIKEEYQQELPIALERAWKEYNDLKDECYEIRTERKYCRIPFDNILYMVKDKKYTVFYCLDNVTYRERDAMENIYKAFPKKRFVVVSRGVVINLKYIQGLTSTKVKLKGGIILPISRGQLPSVRESYANYWREK